MPAYKIRGKLLWQVSGKGQDKYGFKCSEVYVATATFRNKNRLSKAQKEKTFTEQRSRKMKKQKNNAHCT